MLLGRYLCQAVFIDPALFSEFKGADFREAFGPALRQGVCAFKRAECADCLLLRRCLYPFVFTGTEHKDRRPLPSARRQRSRPEGRRPGEPLKIVPRQDQEWARERLAPSPAPCVIEPPEGERVRFSAREGFAFTLLLFGKANESLPHFIQAVRQMGQQGVGRPAEGRRGRFLLQAVRAGDRILYGGEGQPLPDVEVATQDLKKRLLYDLATTPVDLPGSLTVRLSTPLKLKREVGRRALPFETLVRETLRRIASLCHAYGNGEPALDYRGLADRAARVQSLAETLEPFAPGEGGRRREREMLEGALTGEVRYGEGWGEFLPLLRFAEQVHLGEGTIFGLGRIELVRPA